MTYGQALIWWMGLAVGNVITHWLASVPWRSVAERSWFQLVAVLFVTFMVQRMAR